MIRRLIPFLLLLAFLAGGARGAEVIPPAPRDHFNDYARVVSPETARLLNTELVQFESDTSNQLLVAIFPRLQSDSSIEDYTVRVKQAWGVGRKDKDNGAVLFIFSEDRKLYIQVGYGLEGALPDALCKRIIEDEITPRFREGDFDGGVRAGTRALMAAARGEYKGTGRTVADRARRSSSPGGFFSLFVALIIGSFLLNRFSRRNVIYNRRGRSSPWISTGGWGGGGSFGGGGGGSFSGGGGGGGGGGAGGRW